MKREKKAVVGLLVAANMIGAVAIGNAVAAEKKSNYVQAKVGVLQPTSGLDDAGFDTGLNGAITYGRYLTRHLVLEGTIDGSAANNDVDGYNDFTGHYTQKDDIGIMAFLLTLKGEFSVGQVNLYGGGGIGAYVVTLNSEIESNRIGDYEKDDSDTVFGVHLLAGANYDITEDWFAGIEGTYRWTGKAKIEENIIGVPVSYNDDVNGFSIAASVGYRF
jgi:opacity protein-like surface antigen